LAQEVEEPIKKLDQELKEFKNELIVLLNIALEKEIKDGRYKAEIYEISEFSFYEKLKLGVINLLKKDNKIIFATTIAWSFGITFSLLGLLTPGYNIIEIIGAIINGIITFCSIYFFVKLINKKKFLKKN